MHFTYLYPKVPISSPIILQTRYVVCTNFVEVHFYWQEIRRNDLYQIVKTLAFISK